MSCSVSCLWASKDTTGELLSEIRVGPQSRRASASSSQPAPCLNRKSSSRSTTPRTVIRGGVWAVDVRVTGFEMFGMSEIYRWLASTSRT